MTTGGGDTNNNAGSVHGSEHEEAEHEFDPFICEDESSAACGSLSESGVLPASLWYHGFLSRPDAERRLRDSGRQHCFLIRESNRRPCSYVLSCLDRGSVKHYRISFAGGQYFLYGQSFDNLSAVVKFFLSSTVGGGLDSTRRYAVAPPEPVPLIKRNVITKVAFRGAPDTDELTFQKDDVLTVQEDVGDAWLWTKSFRTGDSGMVCDALVETLSDKVDPVRLPYVHMGINRQVLSRKLQEEGSFLVRESESAPGSFTVCLNTGSRIDKFLVRRMPDGRFEFGGRVFTSLHDIIQRYQESEICEGHALETPIFKSRAESGKKSSGSPADSKSLFGLVERNRSSLVTKALVSGYVYHKSKEYKRWKSMHLAIYEDGQLYISEKDTSTKPKFVIELCDTLLFPVHTSLFDRPNCFQLSIDQSLSPLITDSTSHFFCTESYEEYLEWCSVIRNYCSDRTADITPASSRLMFMRHLEVKIYEIADLSVKHGSPEMYCVVALNSAKLCRTLVQPSASSVVWDEDFLIEDIPASASFLDVNLCQRSRRAKDAQLASVYIDLDERNNNRRSVVAAAGGSTSGQLALGGPDGQELDLIDAWYGMTPAGTGLKHSLIENGRMRVGLRIFTVPVMPTEEYGCFKDVLSSSDYLMCHYLGEALPVGRPRLSRALYDAFFPQGDHLSLIIAENCRELDAATDPRLLFRSNSLSSSLMDRFMQATATTYVKETLQPLFDRVVESRVSCEIDPTRLDPSTPDDSIVENTKHLTRWVEEACANVLASAPRFPKPLAYVLAMLHGEASRKWPNDKLLRARVISSFVFLRLFCLALTYPRRYCLLTDAISLTASRTLLMVAKVLQNVSTSTPFGAKEPYMVVMNPVVESKQSSMSVFLEQIVTSGAASASSYGPTGPQSRDGLSRRSLRHVNEAKPLAAALQLAVGCYGRLKDLEREEAKVRDFLHVLDVLDSHQKRYAAQLLP